MKKILYILSFILFFSSCQHKSINLKKIETELQEQLITSGYTKDVELTLTSKDKGKLYNLYKNKIKDLETRKYELDILLDSIYTYKREWLSILKEKEFDPNETYEDIIKNNKYELKNTMSKLDSLKDLYKNTPKDIVYYKLHYDLLWVSLENDKKYKNTLEVYVDENSKIIEWNYLNIDKEYR